MCQLMLPLGSDPFRLVITAATAAAARERARTETGPIGPEAAEADRTMRSVWAAAFAGIAANPEMGGDDYNLIESLCCRASADARLVRMLAGWPSSPSGGRGNT